jgi:hypothetical protein
MSRYENAGQALIGGVQAGQGIRANYENKKSADALKEASTKYFERLRSLGAEEVESAGALPIPESGGSEDMAAAAAAVQGGALPTDGSSVQPKPKKKYRSVTADDYRELDTMAAQMATMAGDPKAYDAYRGMARSYAQGRIMDQMRRAQVALQVGDQEGLEDALQRAYQFVPDGQELKLKRGKDGALTFKHPTSGEDLPVNAQSLRLFSMAALDPDAMEETMYGRKKDKTKEDQEARGLDINQQNANTSTKNAETQAAQVAETARSNRANEGREAKNDVHSNRLKDAQALQALSYANYLDTGKKGKTEGALDPDKARKFAGDVRTLTEQYIMPTEKRETTDELGGTKVIDAPAARLPGFENATVETINTVSSYAEQVGIANPQLGLSQAVGAGAVIYQALQGKADIDIDPNSNLLSIPVGGKRQIFRVPPELIQTLLMQSQQAPPQQGALPPR